MNTLSKRLSLFKYFSIGYILFSLLLRVIFLFWQIEEVDLSIINLIRILFTGIFYDIGVLSFVSVIVSFYIFIFPNKWIGSIVDRVIIYTGFFIASLIFVFTFFAEITFWDEFHCRFNFVAVDYLIYTYEVVKNINESYPLIILIPSILVIIFVLFYVLYKQDVFKQVFLNKITFKERVVFFSSAIILCFFYSFFIKNNQAEWSINRYNNEISKAGIYSFFSELRNNKLDFKTFYENIDDKEAFLIVKKYLTKPNAQFINENNFEIKRLLKDSLVESKPNVIFILMESMSADFMTHFGNENKITPFLDSIAQKSIFFENLYATGNRTVRGMEAVTLSIPPTPGQSIVKRPKNQNLFTVANVFKEKQYTCNFFYGGDGYFDNMNAFYGGNGFNIFDRGRGSILADDIKTIRTNINDEEVTHENAWGICDEDIYNKMLQEADKSYQKKESFFNFIMTTSNHRPYTYPEGKIDIPSGKNRDGAVKYSDYALSQLMKKAQKKPWFKNTVFVFIADHCASSAGKDEINVKNYHIPAIIYGSNLKPMKVTNLCSQIDIFPTLFGLFHWNYTSNFFGEDVLDSHFQSRAFIATYLKLGLMKDNDNVCILSNKGISSLYKLDTVSNSLINKSKNKEIVKETIAWYQVADYLYLNDKLN